MPTNISQLLYFLNLVDVLQQRLIIVLDAAKLLTITLTLVYCNPTLSYLTYFNLTHLLALDLNNFKCKYIYSKKH